MSSPFPNIETALKTTSSAILALGTVCYIAGLLIVNLHLAHFGIHSQEFNRTEYVLAGAVFLGLSAGAWYAMVWALEHIKSGYKAYKERRYGGVASSAMNVFAAIIAPAYALSLLSSQTLLYTDWRMWVSIGALAFIPWIITGVTKNLKRLWAHYTSNDQGAKGIAETAVGVFQTVVGLTGFLGTYALVTYPHISASYGGGLREPSFILPSKLGFAAASNLGLPIAADNEVGPIYILSVSSSEIVLTTDQFGSYGKPGAALRLKRELAEAIRTSGDASAKTAEVSLSPSDIYACHGANCGQSRSGSAAYWLRL